MTDREFPEARLLIFAKTPAPGRVKTRLVPKYGPRGAASIYKTLMRRTLDLAAQARLCPIQLWCAPGAKHPFFAACRRDYGVVLKNQHRGDLGRRMHHALNDTLTDCEYAVLIGCDCLLEAIDLRLALNLLKTGRDAVLGPAEDGGYVLIGLRRPCRKLFNNVAWGGSRVLTATRRRLRAAGLEWAELPPRRDVDRPEDVRRLNSHDLLELRGFDQPRTQASAISSSPKDRVVYRSTRISFDQ